MQRLAILTLLTLIAACAPPQPDPITKIDVADLLHHTRILSDDAMGGRAPASEGEELTVNYLKQQFERLGIAPGNGDSYFQPVPLVAVTSTAEALRISGAGQEFEFSMPADSVLWTKHLTEQVSLESSELVFVGYGVVAPEYGWNDYEGLDVRGKTVVMLVNDPGYALQDERFNGRTMTYYGRWTYKFEEAARQGAAAAIVIHETGPAGYPWEVVSGSWTGPQFDLVSEDGNASRPKVEGWITESAAEQLFAAVGSSYAEMKALAQSDMFMPVTLPLTASASVAAEFSTIESRNVIAAIPGSEFPEETVIFTAHWDHLGTDPATEGDGIFNGAVDNATGVSGILELAEAFAANATAPKRTVVFLAVTAEESGLLGSRWYAEHPVYPLADTVAAINMDSMNVYGRTRDVIVVGYGNSELEEYLATAAATQNRTLVREEHPERGYFYRSDHFNFAKQGVPALYAESGSDFHGENAATAKQYADAYTAERYHKPADEYADWWDVSGAVEDLQLYYLVGHQLANSRDWPNWHEGNEFRAVRDAARGSSDQR